MIESHRERGRSHTSHCFKLNSTKDNSTYSESRQYTPNDCFNYVPKNKLSAAFKNVARALKKGGVFLFDVSSERKFREKIANTVCADDREHITYLAFNKTDEEKTTMDVTLFVKRPDGAFERYDETHVQYIHKEKEICEQLKQSGFSVISVEGHLGEEKEKSDRICFLAKKE